MAFKDTIAKMEKEDAKRSKDIFLNQLIATFVILALVIWVAVLFRSWWAIGFLVIIIIVMYAAFIPKRKFKK